MTAEQIRCGIRFARNEIAAVMAFVVLVGLCGPARATDSVAAGVTLGVHGASVVAGRMRPIDVRSSGACLPDVQLNRRSRKGVLVSCDSGKVSSIGLRLANSQTLLAGPEAKSPNKGRSFGALARPTFLSQGRPDTRSPVYDKRSRRATHPGKDAVTELVYKLAPQYQLSPDLVLAVIEVESNFNPDALSPKDAQGLMQLIPQTAIRFGVADVWDPEQNLRGGMAYLRWLLDHFDGDMRLALAGYNAGEGAVAQHGGIPPYRETQAYVSRIAGRLGM